jgi:hypothetical protein
MKFSAITPFLLAGLLASTAGCDSKTDDKKAETKSADAKKAGDAKKADAKTGDAKTGDAKAGEAKADDAKAGEAKPEGEAAAAAPAAEVKLVAVDLGPVGPDWAGWSVMAPEGVTAKESFGAAQLTNGTTFNLDIRNSKGDVAGFKKDIAANDINKVKQFVVDSADALLYESEVMGQNEFHVYGNVTIGEQVFNCEDVKGPRHMQADAEAMWKTCGSLTKKK